MEKKSALLLFMMFIIPHLHGQNNGLPANADESFPELSSKMYVSGDDFRLYPNPVSSSPTVEFFSPYAGDVQIQITSISGIKILSDRYHVFAGTQGFVIRALSEGMYLLNISGTGFFYTCALINTNISEEECGVFLQKSHNYIPIKPL